MGFSKQEYIHTSRGFSEPRDRTRVSYFCCIGSLVLLEITEIQTEAFSLQVTCMEMILNMEVKGKGEKERYKHLNAEFQRIARRDKKAFLSNQCKEIEENNRMGKTRDLCKKIRHTKGTFHAKMGLKKDRNGMDLTEAEDIQKRWQEYTEELYKKDLHTPDNHDGVITDLEPVILECEVKWALEKSLRTKLVEVIEFQLSYSKS